MKLQKWTVVSFPEQIVAPGTVDDLSSSSQSLSVLTLYVEVATSSPVWGCSGISAS
jgi:hypothetical protein